VQLARNDGFIFMQILLQLNLVDGRIDVSHENRIVVFVVGEGSEDNIVFLNFIALETL
jgi:hypothetical protein